MATQFLTYRKDKGMISIEVSIENTPTWNYRYRFGLNEVVENDNAKNGPKSHDLATPSNMSHPEHRWHFLLTNIASFPAPNVTVRIDWYQQQDGIKVLIHKWHPASVTIKAESGHEFEDRVILNPQ